MRSFLYGFLVSVLLSFQINLVRSTQQCATDNCANTADSYENKYTESANSIENVISTKIKDALAAHKPCLQKNCSCHIKTLENDLQPFIKTGITKEMFRTAEKKGVLYQIISGKLYRQKECLFPARCSGVEYFFLQLIDKIPNTEFIINTRDWPQLNKHWGHPLAPVFSFSKTDDYWDIMYPAWSFWEGGPAIKLYPTGLGKWQQHRKIMVKSAEKWPWEDKKKLAFFRGSRTSDERDPIVLLSRTRPDLVDAKYTKNQAWKSDADTLNEPPAEEVSLEDHCKYKYLFNYRGVAASFRFKHLFLCRSLVFHVGNEWLEFFYPSLKPWVHYIPVSSKASQNDIKDMIEFFVANDELAKDVAERGYQHIWDHLRITDVKCYWKKILLRYTNLLKYTVQKNNDLIEIKK